jgi:hypothetical protein
MRTRSNKKSHLSSEKNTLNFASEKPQIEGFFSRKKKYPSYEIKPIQ